MKSANPLSDDDVIRRIRDAFNQEEVPECPSEDELSSHLESKSVATIPPATVPALGRSSNWVANLVVIVAIAGIAFFLFGSFDDDPKVETPRDNLVQLIHPEDVDPVESVAQQENSKAEPNPVTQNDGKDLPSDGLVDVVAAANDFLTGQGDNPDVLIDQLHAHFGVDRSQLQLAFRDLGSPTGIASVQQDVDSERRWVRGEGQMSFTYRFDYPQILNDLKRFIEGYYGDRIVEDVLDGMRDDVDGPQVDVRNNLFPLLDSELILVVDSRSGPLSETVTVILPVKDPTRAWQVVNQLHRAAPTSARENYKGVEMLQGTSADSRQTAWCVVENCLIVGGPKNVRSIIDRLNE